ncbi:MAG: ModD protein [Campylobacteraceae bacterium]
MVFITDSTLDFWLKEDVSYIDLTTFSLGIGDEDATFEIYARDECILCGSEEIERLAKKLNINLLHVKSSGKKVKDKELVFKAFGKAKDIHILWRVSTNILSFASSIATRTNRLVTLAKEVNKNIAVGSTRKSTPATRALSTKAVLCGGGIIHRLGLSETFLMFDEHKVFFNSNDDIIKKLQELRHTLAEKTLSIEVKSVEEGTVFAPFVDILQVDKLSPEDVNKIVLHVKTKNLKTKVAVAGGVNEKNIKEYAKTGADFLVTSSMFQNSSEIDFGVRITKGNS